MKKLKNKNALYFLRCREMGFCASIPRNDYRLFTALVLSNKRVYRKKEEYNSSCPIFFEADRIYLNHYRCAYSVVKRNLIYDLDQSSLFQTTSKERITDADIFYLTSASEPADIPCTELFVGLTDLHRLLLLNATTGKFLKSFQLPAKDCGYKFSELGIGKDNETLYVKGRLMARPPASRQPHFVFAIFSLAPFLFQCMFVVDEMVVGSFTNVMISQDLLIFAHNGSLLKFYSLEDMIYRAKDIEDVDIGTNGTLRPNVTITWPCPCLYEVRVTSDTLEMGGFPWHCLYKPPKKIEYQLQALATDKLVVLEKGELREAESGQGMEVNVFFNPDESGSLIHVTEQEIKKLLITENGGPEAKSDYLRLTEAWSFTISDQLTGEEDIVYTASGRKSTSRSSWLRNIDLQFIQCVQYSSSMDMLTVVVYYETPFSETAFKSGRKRQEIDPGKAKLLLVDNETGRLKKTICLDELWDNACEEHHIELDDDVMIHTIKHRTGKHSCHVYRLTEALEGSPADSAKRKKRPQRQPRIPRARKRRAGSDTDDDWAPVQVMNGGSVADREYNFRRRDR